MSSQQQATLILKVKDGATSAFNSIKNSFGGIALAATAVIASLAAIGKQIFDMAMAADELDAVRQSFTNMATSQGQDADKMLAKMKELSRGTVSDLELMKQANTAMMLGLPVEQLGDMMEVARSAARSTGQSMEFMLQSIVTGLGRGSKMILDNLGILVDTNKAYENFAAANGRVASQLTETEKKQAFINEALRVGKENAAAAGDSGLTMREKWEQLKVTIENISMTVGEFFIPAVTKAIELMSAAATGASTLASIISEELNAALGGAPTTLEEVRGRMVDLLNTMDRLEKQSAGGGMSEVTRRQYEEAQKNYAAMEALQNEMIQKQLDLEDKRNQAIAVKDQIAAEERRQAAADQAMSDYEERLARQEEELALIGLEGEAKNTLQNEIELRRINDQLKNEEDRITRMDLLKQKELALEKVAGDKKRKADEEANKKLLQDRDKFLGQIATLQNSHNKVMVTLGKAAAIGQITINTADAAMSGYKWGVAIGGPTLGSVFAGLAIAAGAAQAAKVAGVQLAQGGIVRATPGGIQATIGEGGRNEAVLPLPDDFDPENLNNRGGNTFIFNGPLLGDEEQARQFARVLDTELMKLRRRNESVAFDEDLF